MDYLRIVYFVPNLYVSPFHVVVILKYVVHFCKNQKSSIIRVHENFVE